jgi:hypothetical protein
MEKELKTELKEKREKELKDLLMQVLNACHSRSM